MSDQYPTPDPQRRDDRPAGAAEPVPDQPSYPPQPYGQPGYAPQQYQGNPSYQQYPQDPSYQQYPQDPSYQQQYQQYQQQYPPYQQYPPAGYQQQWPQEQPQSQTLGLVGFGIVGLCTVVLAVVSYLMGGQFGQFILDYGLETVETINPTDPVFIAFSQQVQGLSTAGSFATFGGIAGWIVSIIATSRRRGRTYGIWGIVLGILAPVIGIVALMMGLWPALSVLAG